MRLQQLIYFEKIIEKGSINEAAKALYLTQPSLSNALKELENEMKVQLLVRNKQGIIPTAEGREFLIYVRQILIRSICWRRNSRMSRCDARIFQYPLSIMPLWSMLLWSYCAPSMPRNIISPCARPKQKIFSMISPALKAN